MLCRLRSSLRSFACSSERMKRKLPRDPLDPLARKLTRDPLDPLARKLPRDPLDPLARKLPRDPLDPLASKNSARFHTLSLKKSAEEK